jgi:hypothetical protein
MSTDLIVGQLKFCSSLLKLLWTGEFFICTKLISFTFCVCFTFQHQLWVVYVLCKIGDRNSGLLLILRKRPSVLRALLLHHSTWPCKISGWKTVNKHLDWRLKNFNGTLTWNWWHKKGNMLLSTKDKIVIVHCTWFFCSYTESSVESAERPDWSNSSIAL